MRGVRARAPALLALVAMAVTSSPRIASAMHAVDPPPGEPSLVAEKPRLGIFSEECNLLSIIEPLKLEGDWGIRSACTTNASGSRLFLQRDPNGYEDSVNLYAGMRWDPVNLRDPTGLAVPVAAAAAWCAANPACRGAFGAVVGGALGAGLEAGRQLLNGESLDEQRILGAAVQGGVYGGLLAASAGSIGAGASVTGKDLLGYGVIGIASGSAGAAARSEEYQAEQGVFDGLSSAVLGGTFQSIGNRIRPTHIGAPSKQELDAAARAMAEVRAEQSALLPKGGVRRPAPRHTATRVNQKTVAQDINTMIDPSVPVAEDVAAINGGLSYVSRNDLGQVTATVSGRTYVVEANGTLSPRSGPGFFNLTRGAFKALGDINVLGPGPRSDRIMTRGRGLSLEDRISALIAWSRSEGMKQ